MFCSQCRAQIDEDSKFCRLCGNPTSSLVEKPLPVQQAVTSSKSKVKYVGLLAGVLIGVIVGMLDGNPLTACILAVPGALVGFAIGGIIDRG